MKAIRQTLVALALIALVLSWVWTPWVAVVMLAAIGAWLFWQLQRQDDAAAALLREPESVDRSFDDAMAIIRARLKEGEQSLRDRDAEIAQRKQITNAVPDGLFLLDNGGRIIWCNQAALVMHSLDAFRDMGKPIAQLIRAPEFARYLDDDTQPEPVVTLGGRSIAFHLERGSEGARLLLTRDVTEREKLDRMRRDFVANVSHELRTPLTVVGGFVETLTDLPLEPDERNRYLQLIANQTTNMRRLVEDLLTLARLENDQLPPEATQIDLALVARDALADAEALSAGAHTFEATIAPAHLLGSVGELRSALGNLLSNAVRYTPAGGRITLHAHQADGWLHLGVSDSGAGISPADKPHLFDRFYQARHSAAPATGKGGRGLGLAIVKRIAELHGGTVGVESDEGVGTVVTLRLPVRS